MTERLTIEADTRVAAAEKAKNLRKEGVIPAVIYGKGENTLVKFENLALRRILREAGTTNLIDINVGDATRTVVVKEVQSHATRGDLIHVDFFEVDMKVKLIVDAVLTPVGVAAPEANGLGTVSMSIHSLQIECMPENMISTIEVDMSQIEKPEDMIYVRDLPVTSGVEVLEDLDTVIARFEYTPIEEEEEEEEEEELMFAPAADEVEVITKGKQPEDEEFED